MRIILMTGKGGVGKTSVATATAVLCAEMGKRTLVVSTDAAHSLGDSLGRKVGHEPVEVGENLFAQEIDVQAEIDEAWGAVRDYHVALFASQGVNDVVAEEMSVFPGMEELASLLRIKAHLDEGAYDVLIVDCAPTGSTLRLLSLPETLRWYMRRLFHIERAAMRTIRPVAQRLTNIPLPADEVYAAFLDLYNRIDGVKQQLCDPRNASVRLVTNPERMAIEESRRAFTHLCLYGMPTDAVIANRQMPAAVTDPYFEEWKRVQAEHMEEIRSAFAPLPVLTVPLMRSEIVGMERLREMGRAIYGDRDPTAVMCDETPVKIEVGEGDEHLLKLKLPFATKEKIELLKRGADLTITANGQRRNVLLPYALARMETRGARFEDDWLVVRFAPKRSEPSRREEA
ncbi:MAG: ArsA family ATPase [Armatimonadota bacterium]